ncbi:RNA polymerase sigma-70 factor (ECF subfamily) [Rhizobium halophytocola]|uniref:RNA polymerase sigma-70 factor (ECF subfamily) n=1 Tax=Rhizobium halophytocola TaxID=735519 RepID=A0ABS4E3G6_9HYPH|nr:RNA polymerase sigma-70 factor (ECF subfamily) [Rhizobium halophytocola]
MLAAVAEGDMVAFEKIYHRYFPKLMHFARRIAGSSEAAEEIANDTLMVVWRTADRFEGRSKPSSWIFGIAYRLSLKQRQSLGRRKGEVVLDENLVDDNSDTADAVMRQKDLDGALQQLTPELRAVVELTYYNGYLYTEIAEILGCPVGTVKTRMMTARRRLRAMLSDDPQLFSENAVAWTLGVQDQETVMMPSGNSSRGS